MGLNLAKCKRLALENIQANGLRVLGTCVAVYSPRERFLKG